ncbi:pilus assembly protein [uncultured Roseibium sp.]|uniref:pilus assembly protein n=1 Tax=uncultured Roseibium sp. TaxID=1936171 RepID=UPI00321651EE
MLSAAIGQLRISAARFARNASGSILPMFAIMAVVLLVIGGAAVDYSRAINARATMANALDAAALSIASQLSSSIMKDKEIDQSLEDWFAANLNDMGYTDVAIKNLQHTVDPEAGTISVSSTVGVPTKFIHIGGIGPKTIEVGVDTEVNYSKFDVELALVLDVTGSMGGDMQTLKDAANSLIDTLISKNTPESESKIRISIVPYSQGVNLGEYAQAVTDGNKGTRNCVTERNGDAQYTDDPYDYDKNNEESYFGGGSENCAATPQMEPLTAKRNKLTSAIKKLTANGSTAGQTGIAWGWYSLSPKWTNLWPAKSAPADYDDDEILKFAVIMTDGDFNTYYNYENQTKCSGRGWGRKCWTVKGWTEKRESEYASNTSSTRAKKLCSAMKDEGIDVYTIYFGSNGNSAGAKVMKSCATSVSSTFYMASSNQELISAFGNIAKKVQAIYLAK